MTSKLKLTGVKSFMSVLLNNVNVRKGEVVLLNDDLAGKIGGLSRQSDNDDIKVYFFTEAKASDEVTYDFTRKVPPTQGISASQEASIPAARQQAAPPPEPQGAPVQSTGDAGVASDTGTDLIDPPDRDGGNSDVEDDPVQDPVQGPGAEQDPTPAAKKAVARKSTVQRKKA